MAPGGCWIRGGGLEGKRVGSPALFEPLCPHSAPNVPTWSLGHVSGRCLLPQPPGTPIGLTFMLKTFTYSLGVSIQTPSDAPCCQVLTH